MELNRAYSMLDVKSINDGERVIEGIASTPTPDRMGDIVEPMGAKFALPMPLLLYHDSSLPVGEVFFAKPTKTGIPFKARVASVDEAGTVKDRLDEAWQSVKAKLIRGVSIGFRALEYSFLDGGGIRFSEWEWMELSLVAIPANADASINSIKSADQAARRALQGKRGGHLVVHLPAVTRGLPVASGQLTTRKGAVYL
jgi:HK97 family phage prohead protease